MEQEYTSVCNASDRFYIAGELVEGDLIIPESVDEIGKYAFAYFDRLTSVTMDANTNKIGKSAFTGCNFASVNYNGTLEQWCNINFEDDFANPVRIAKHLYINGELIEGELQIPNCIESIGASQFAGLEDITMVSIPSNISSIERYAFVDCKNLQAVVFADDSKITKIGYSAFSQCEGLVDITLPENIESIGGNAFNSCVRLKSINIPNNMKIIEGGAFRNCLRLTNVYIDQENSCLESIEQNAFCHCESLKEIIFPDNLKKIGAEAFSYCTSLICVQFGENSQLTSFGGGCEFADCVSLLSITIPDGVKSIPRSIFSHCESLESIVIPANVEYIWFYAFYRCDSLKLIMFKGTKEQWKKIEIKNYNDEIDNVSMVYNFS